MKKRIRLKVRIKPAIIEEADVSTKTTRLQRVLDKAGFPKTYFDYIKILTTLMLVIICMTSFIVGLSLLVAPFIVEMSNQLWLNIVIIFAGTLFIVFGIFTLLAYKSIEKEKREEYILSFFPSLVAFVALVFSLISLLRSAT